MYPLVTTATNISNITQIHGAPSVENIAHLVQCNIIQSVCKKIYQRTPDSETRARYTLGYKIELAFHPIYIMSQYYQLLHHRIIKLYNNTRLHSTANSTIAKY
jgi:hypothetical protein